MCGPGNQTHKIIKQHSIQHKHKSKHQNTPVYAAVCAFLLFRPNSSSQTPRSLEALHGFTSEAAEATEQRKPPAGDGTSHRARIQAKQLGLRPAEQLGWRKNPLTIGSWLRWLQGFSQLPKINNTLSCCSLFCGHDSFGQVNLYWTSDGQRNQEWRILPIEAFCTAHSEFPSETSLPSLC